MVSLINLSGLKCVFLSVSFMMIWCAEAYTNFYVGGKDGWVYNPYESFNHWAERNRFQVNDTLVFRYKTDHDSVLVVSKGDYYKCKKGNAIQKLNADAVESKFTFPCSGAFFFISGLDDNCEKGQKLAVVVLAVRNGSLAIPPETSVMSLGPSAMVGSPSADVAPPGPGKNTTAVFAPPRPKAAAPELRRSWAVVGFISIGISVVLGGLMGF